jgi:hypothetical protein
LPGSASWPDGLTRAPACSGLLEADTKRRKVFTRRRESIRFSTMLDKKTVVIHQLRLPRRFLGALQ